MATVCLHAISEQRFWQLPDRVEASIRSRLPVDGELVVVRSLPELVSEIKRAHLVMGWPFPAAMVKSAKELRAVHFFTSGIPESWQRIESENENEKKKKNIRVTTTQSGSSARSVAEHALFLTTALLRGATRSSSFASSTWAPDRSPFVPRAAETMRACIFGAGAIGSEIAKLFAPLFASVTAVGRAQSADWQRLLADNDVVVLALPLSAETRALLSSDFFLALRPGTLLINVASGALVAEENVLAFLARDPRNRYASDVAHPEPYPSEGALFDAKNEQVLLTPHLGARREDAWDAIEKRALEVLSEAL
jgi:phosphoglycerate dehydrogenase-like enzyme